MAADEEGIFFSMMNPVRVVDLDNSISYTFTFV